MWTDGLRCWGVVSTAEAAGKLDGNGMDKATALFWFSLVESFCFSSPVSPLGGVWPMSLRTDLLGEGVCPAGSGPSTCRICLAPCFELSPAGRSWPGQAHRGEEEGASAFALLETLSRAGFPGPQYFHHFGESGQDT